MTQEPSITFSISDGSGSVVLDAKCLLVFVDETGHELFADPRHPLFGLGGCALLVHEYVNYVRPQWLQLKERYFGRADISLHANELRLPTQVQLAALNDVFASRHFARFAAVATEKSILPDEYSTYQLVSQVMLARIERIARQFPFSRIALLVESSYRANVLAERHLGPYNKADVEYLERKAQVPIDHYFIPKTMNEPGMEIADFIMHAVGGQVRSELTGQGTRFRKDFKAVFQDVPRELVEYMNIQNAMVNDA
jgi:hypothetical protein